MAEDALRMGLREGDKGKILDAFDVDGEELNRVIDDIQFIVKNEEEFIKKCVAERIVDKCCREYGYRFSEDEFRKEYDDMIDEAVDGMLWWNYSDIEKDNLKDDILGLASKRADMFICG